MDIFVSGYGKLNIDTDFLSFRLVYEEKLNFEKKIIYCNQGRNNTSYEKQNELIEHHSVLQYFVN